jgi:hypothetical protein
MKLRRTPYSFRIILKHFTIYKLFLNDFWSVCTFWRVRTVFRRVFPTGVLQSCWQRRLILWIENVFIFSLVETKTGFSEQIYWYAKNI